MAIVFSGMQPTGAIHLGNYLGMVDPLLELNKTKEHKTFCSIVDLHATTIWQNPADLRQNSLNLAAFLIAAGLNNSNSLVFLQSSIKEHAELTWMLSCTARIGWLNRMIQFKEKSGDNKEKASCGLYFYPVLMAADILLYNAELVPVGEDQKQHLEFARDVAIKFNNDYSTNFFKAPNPLILPGARVMSLKNGTKKMSKSDPADYAKILFSDSNDIIAQKIKKATTDSLPIEGTEEDIKKRPEVYNLLNIYALLNKISLKQALTEFNGQGFAKLKQALTENLINLISPLRLSYNELLQDKSYLMQTMQENSCIVRDIAATNVKAIKEIIGFVKS